MTPLICFTVTSLICVVVHFWIENKDLRMLLGIRNETIDALLNKKVSSSVNYGEPLKLIRGGK